jgi:hypothetical protein
MTTTDMVESGPKLNAMGTEDILVRCKPNAEHENGQVAILFEQVPVVGCVLDDGKISIPG